ncbi:MAG: outer membrane beta-barrel protein [Alphaproteobacteria bacterium]|nr:outer membrane beta-barrel protein [Alphaproteobacteria bacterium]
MNTKKILSVVVLTAAAASGAVASNASSNKGWGFYAGLDAGLSFDRYKENRSELTATKDSDWAKFCRPANNKSKTSPVVDLLFGAEYEYDRLFFAGELFAGLRSRKFDVNEFTVSTGTGDPKTCRGNIFSVKNNLNFGIMLKFGYFVLPKVRIYAGAGLDCARMRYKYAPILTPLLMILGTDSREATLGSKVGKSKMALSPIVALGTRWDISERFYARLEYNYRFPKRIRQGGFKVTGSSGGGRVLPVNGKVNVRLHSQIVKLGFGVRF